MERPGESHEGVGREKNHRMPICLRSLSDNSGAESGSNNLWSMTYPLSIFLERMCLLSAMLGMEIDDRIRISLSDLWNIRRSPTLILKDASLPWSLPTALSIFRLLESLTFQLEFIWGELNSQIV